MECFSATSQVTRGHQLIREGKEQFPRGAHSEMTIHIVICPVSIECIIVLVAMLDVGNTVIQIDMVPTLMELMWKRLT